MKNYTSMATNIIIIIPNTYTGLFIVEYII